MVAISRALLLNPRLLVMDEPTEGLAPVIVAQLEEMLVRLGEDGDMSVLVIEQNIGVATAISRNVAIMVNGRVNRVIDSGRLAADRDLQQRLLGVGLHGDIELAVEATPSKETDGAPQQARAKGPVRIFISNPVLPTRWSQPVPIARIEAAARTASTGVTRLEEVTRPRREAAVTQTSGAPVVLIVGTRGHGPGTFAMLGYEETIPAKAIPRLDCVWPAARKGEPPVRQLLELKERC